MHLKHLYARDFKCFMEAKLDFDISAGSPNPNLHVLLGENGTGKSALLQAIALAVLNHSLRDSGPFLRAIIRRQPDDAVHKEEDPSALLYAQVDSWGPKSTSPIKTYLLLVPSSSGRDTFENAGIEEDDDQAFNSLMNDEDKLSFFIVGYGANRRTSPGGGYRFDVHDSQYSLRFQRVASLFSDDFYLVPLSAWYPNLNSSRRHIVDEVIGKLLGDSLKLTNQIEDGELVVWDEGVKLPINALSDGYQSFLSWICDLIWRLMDASDKDKDFREVQGVVLVDKVDLHLHPEWQRNVLQTLSDAFPKLQFIVTTHSPLIVGGIYKENIHIVRKGSVQSCESSPYGLSSDQILLSPIFGLDGVRTPKFEDRLNEVRQEAMSGDLDAFTLYTNMMIDGAAGDHELEKPTGKKIGNLPYLKWKEK